MTFTRRIVESLSVLSTVCLVGLGATAEEIENLAANPGFEELSQTQGMLPRDWAFFTSSRENAAVSTDVARSGTHSLKFTAQGTAGDRMGLIQEIPVEEGKKYTFRAYVRGCKDDRLKGTCFGLLGIEWIGDQRREIARAESDVWRSDLSRMRWTRFEVTAEAPPEAKTAKFVIHSFEGDGMSKGSCFVDDVTITVKD